MSNIGAGILDKLDRRLFAQPGHPLQMVKAHIAAYFSSLSDNDPACPFPQFDHFDPIVGVKENFDDLCFPYTHPGRSRSDSYFINNQFLLRTHMTANELEFLKAGKRAFLIAGDVYRRDQIDSTHYPVFHQLEGVEVFERANSYNTASSYVSCDTYAIDTNALNNISTDESPFKTNHGIDFNWEVQAGQDERLLRVVTDDLYQRLTGLMKYLFGPEIPIRWQTCNFPFTCPSFEVEILHRGRWIEVCGSGILQQSILQEASIDSQKNAAWAFGLGLERLAMILFDIPDIRLFWSQDSRFLGQFKSLQHRFQPFSKYPAAWRDLSFWIGKEFGAGAGLKEEFDENGMFDLIREIGGDLIEDVSLVRHEIFRIFNINTCRLISSVKMTQSSHIVIVLLIAHWIEP